MLRINDASCLYARAREDLQGTARTQIHYISLDWLPSDDVTWSAREDVEGTARTQVVSMQGTARTHGCAGSVREDFFDCGNGIY